EQAKEIYRSVKQHHLFAHTKAEKTKLLRQIVNQSAELTRIIREVIGQVSERCGRVKLSAKAKLRQMEDVIRALLPQIKHWMKTGKVATEKILHAGIAEARAIVKGKG